MLFIYLYFGDKNNNEQIFILNKILKLIQLLLTFLIGLFEEFDDILSFMPVKFILGFLL